MSTWNGGSCAVADAVTQAGRESAARAVAIPEDVLAAEIEFAITYAVACNRDRAGEMLLSPPDGCRGEFAGQIAAMLTERAAGGLSGMRYYGIRAGADGKPAD
jgi:hypothetical protein